MSKKILIVILNLFIGCSLFGVQKRNLPSRKQYMLSNAIENRDLATIRSLLNRYAIEPFIPSDLLKQCQRKSFQSFLGVAPCKTPKKKRTRKKKKKSFIVSLSRKSHCNRAARTNDKEALIEAVSLKRNDQIKEIFQNHKAYKTLSSEVINKTFIDAMSGHSINDLKLEQAKIFIHDSVIRESLSGQAVDQAIIKSVRLSCEDIFTMILSHKKLLSKMGTSSKTRKRLIMLFEFMAIKKAKKTYFYRLLLCPEVIERIKELNLTCVTQEMINQARAFKPKEILDLKSLSKEEKALVKAVETKNRKKERLKKIQNLFDNHHSKLSTKVLSYVFIQTITGRMKYLKLDVATLFLEHQIVKKKLNHEALDKAMIKFMQEGFPDYFLDTLHDQALRKKMYIYATGETKKRFEIALKSGLKQNGRKRLLIEFLAYPRLRKVTKHLNFPQSIRKEALALEKKRQEVENRSPQDEALFKAVLYGKSQNVQDILDRYEDSFDKDVVNEAFVDTITGTNKEALKLKKTAIFLEHKNTKELLNHESLNKAVVKFMRLYIKDLFPIILDEKLFREKIYDVDEITNKTKTSVEKALEHASKNLKKLFYQFIAHEDLFDKVEHLDCVTQEAFNKARKFEPKKTLNEYKLTEQEKSLLDAAKNEEEDIVREMLDLCNQTLSKEAVSQIFITIMMVKKELRSRLEVIETFLKHPKGKKKLGKKFLDRAFIKSIQAQLYDIFTIFLEDEYLREKLCRCKETEKSFKGVLTYALNHRIKFLKMILAKADLREKVTRFNCVPQSMIQAAERGEYDNIKFFIQIEDYGLLEAVKDQNEERVEQILKDYGQYISSENISYVFEQAMKDSCFCFDVAQLFLKKEEISGRLSNESLDRAVIKAMDRSYKDIFDMIVCNEKLREKLYESDETKDSFTMMLKRALKKRIYLNILLSYQDILDKVLAEKLNFITQEVLDTARKYLEQTQNSGKNLTVEGTLLIAVKKNNEKTIRDVLNKHYFSQEILNEVFLNAIKRRKERIKENVVIALLDSSMVRRVLSEEVLDEALIKSFQHRFRDILSRILRSKTLRRNLCKSQEKRERLEKTLEKAAKKDLRSLLSHPDLRKKLKHLTFLQNILDEFSNSESSNDSSSDCDEQSDGELNELFGSGFDDLNEEDNDIVMVSDDMVSVKNQLLGAVDAQDVPWVKDVLIEHRNAIKELSLKEKNNLFIRFVTGKDFSPENSKILKIFLKDQKFCDDIQDQTFEKALRFVNTTLSGNNKSMKKVVDGILKIICQHGDLEDKVFEISEDKNFNAILDRFDWDPLGSL